MKQQEDEQTEFKKTTNELNDAMISIASILNKHHKGVLYFGLKNDGTPFRFTITDSTLRDISHKISEAIKPQIVSTVRKVIISGIEVIRVDFSGDNVPYSAFGKYYMRTADENHELSPMILRQLMMENTYKEKWENLKSRETIADVDIDILNKFYNQATHCNRLTAIPLHTSSFTNTTDVQNLLEKLKLLDSGYLTNAGRMLFSKNKPITLKMAVFATEHKDTFLDIDCKEGNIFQLIPAAIEFIIKNIRWRVRLSSDSIHRLEIPEIPIEAIREAIINSFAHAQYDFSLQHEISIFSDRLSITNPGPFANEYLPIDFFNHSKRSFPRNKQISHILYLCREIEAFGSGIRKMYSFCSQNQVNISYINENSVFTIEFSRLDRNTVEIKNISAIETSIMSFLLNNPNSTVDSLSELTHKSVRTIHRILKALRDKQLIERIGSPKTGYWVVRR